MSGFHWVELCCGSAALTWHLIDDTLVSPVSYAGSKYGYAKAIVEALGLENKQLLSVTLNDPGTWGKIWSSVIKTPILVSEACTDIANMTLAPKDLFLALPSMIQEAKLEHEEAALRLVKLSGTFGGKEVGGFRSTHKLRPNVDGYSPNRKTIATRVSAFASIDNNIQWNFYNTPASRVPIPTPVAPDTFVYIDPPYLGSESVYANRFGRDDVLATAIKWSHSGANVVISEACPLFEHPMLAEDGGWISIDITTKRVGQYRKNSKTASEWITLKLRS